jgi:acetoin utilization deacetylase AcuC-like enzyme
MRNSKIKIFYKEQMAFLGEEKNSYSNSPKKPRLFVNRLKKRGDFDSNFSLVKSWNPYDKMDFTLAHYADYVQDFFKGIKPVAESNAVDWSPDFAETVRYTNSSLYQAIRHSYLHPETLCCSPTSGFHHATPDSGMGFCTFSGQVIASRKMYQEFGAVGCYFDLDGHFGNSIEDTRRDKNFKKYVNKAIPKWANINPKGDGKKYMEDLKIKLDFFYHKVISGKIDYVVWCHGADSHKNDNLGSQCNTKQWTECTRLFVETVNRIEKKLGEPFPVSYALFGGYRSKYNEVLDLHERDTEILLTLCNPN